MAKPAWVAEKGLQTTTEEITAVEVVPRTLWSGVAPRPLTASRRSTLLAGEHLFPEHPLFNEVFCSEGSEVLLTPVRAPERTRTRSARC